MYIIKYMYINRIIYKICMVIHVYNKYTHVYIITVFIIYIICVYNTYTYMQ